MGRLPTLGNRREALSAGAFTVLGAIAVASVARPETLASSADADDSNLIRLCLEYERLEHDWAKAGDYDSLIGSPEYEAGEARQDRIRSRMEILAQQINALPTRTVCGFQARARAILSSDYGQIQRQGDYDGLLFALLNQLAEMPG